MGDPNGRAPRWRRAWPWLLFSVAVGLWVATPGSDPLSVNTPAPELAVATTSGEVDLAAQRGRVVVLAFWATWCAACRAEGPVLSRLHRRLEPTGDRVLGVSIDAMTLPALEVAAWRLGMTYPVAVGDRPMFDRFGVQVLPTIYVVGPRGRIRARFTGATSEPTLLAAVEAARDPGRTTN